MRAFSEGNNDYREHFYEVSSLKSHEGGVVGQTSDTTLNLKEVRRVIIYFLYSYSMSIIVNV